MSKSSILHGVSEKRFLATFKHYVLPLLKDKDCRDTLQIKEASFVIISRDTDVTGIIPLPECICN